MSIRNLHYLFEPKSLSIIGASSKPNSVGATVLHNVMAGGFKGQIYPVNPKYDSLAGLTVWPGVAQLPEAPDLAVICTPATSVPQIIHDLGALGGKAAIVLSAGLAAAKDEHGISMKDRMLAAAKPHLLRILGPNCVGLLVPGIHLNASFAHTSALPGKIAFVSQSGAMMTAALDWAKSRGIGFSRFISVGDSADVDFGDILDYLASDQATAAILLYVEAITSARKFMSAARAAARSKPTLIIKAGRAPEGAKAAASHTGAMAGADDVYDAAIRRAGMLRVFSTQDLFDAVETLARSRPLAGERLGIVTNGGGPGVMATDALIAAGGRLADLSELSMQALEGILPQNWSHSNPVDIIGDAPAERYIRTLDVLLQDKGIDALLFIHAPSAIVPSFDIATAVVPVLQKANRNTLACWLGSEGVAAARTVFSKAGIPTYDTPEEAVKGFMQMVQYRRNQDLLMQVPPAQSLIFPSDQDAARRVVEEALAGGKAMLSETESKAVLKAFSIPTVETRIVHSGDEAACAAQEIGFPVVLKILSQDIVHKSDVGGVALGLETADAVRTAAAGMMERISAMRPDARLDGFTVQTMVSRPGALELIIGVATDPVFGPVILFGQGGVAVEVTADHAVALPPLNHVLVRDLISRTRVAKLMAGYRNRAPVDIDVVSHVLIQVAELVVRVPEIVELDINPLLADSNGVIALDARISIRRANQPDSPQLAIRPYPNELEEKLEWQGREVTVRPIRPEDGPAHLAFFARLDPEDIRLRAFSTVRELRPSQVARLTQIDYDREMAFVAVQNGPEGGLETIGAARAMADPDNLVASFAVVVRSDMKGMGLGRVLMQKLIRYCSKRGIGQLCGETLSYNQPMLALAKSLGFRIEPSADPSVRTLILDLAKPAKP